MINIPDIQSDVHPRGRAGSLNTVGDGLTSSFNTSDYACNMDELVEVVGHFVSLMYTHEAKVKSRTSASQPVQEALEDELLEEPEEYERICTSKAIAGPVKFGFRNQIVLDVHASPDP